MMRSSPPFWVNCRSSSISRRRPLHLMKDTSMSMWSADTISFFSSVYICGSWMAPVNNELCARDVSGRSMSLAAFPVARRGSFSRKSARSCSARWSTPSAAKSGSLVVVWMVLTIWFARAICASMPPPLSCTLSKPFCTTSVRYCASTLEASAVSMGAVDLRASGTSESSRFSALLMTCSYSPG